MIILRCPACKHKMNYMPRGALNRQKKKKCVYCGRNFTVVEHIYQNLK